ncbi:hypothetical protein ACHWQZ_G015308 [Mnemiopsis leidyi]
MSGKREDNSNFSFMNLANKLKNTGNLIGDATSRLGSNMGVSDINLESLRSVTTNVASNMNIGNLTSNMNIGNLTSNMNIGNLTSNLSNMQNKMQEMATLENLQDGFQSGLGGLEAMSKAGLGGVQAGLGGLEAMSKTVMDNIDAKRKAITMVDDLKAKGNYQLVDTIKTIEYQILLIILYFVMAVCINWYLIEGVEKTVNLVKNSQKFLDDPEFEKNILRMRDSIGSDIRKYSDLNQLKQGMDGLTSGLAQRIQDGAKIVQDGASVLRDSATQRIQDGAKIVTDSASVIRDSVLSKEQEAQKTEKKDEF